jgi:hypothetical protein
MGQGAYLRVKIALWASEDWEEDLGLESDLRSTVGATGCQ